MPEELTGGVCTADLARLEAARESGKGRADGTVPGGEGLKRIGGPLIGRKPLGVVVGVQAVRALGLDSGSITDQEPEKRLVARQQPHCLVSNLGTFQHHR